MCNRLGAGKQTPTFRSFLPFHKAAKEEEIPKDHLPMDAGCWDALTAVNPGTKLGRFSVLCAILMPWANSPYGAWSAEYMSSTHEGGPLSINDVPREYCLDHTCCSTNRPRICAIQDVTGSYFDLFVFFLRDNSWMLAPLLRYRFTCLETGLTATPALLFAREFRRG